MQSGRIPYKGAEYNLIRIPKASYQLKEGERTFDALMRYLDQEEAEAAQAGTTGTKNAKMDELRDRAGLGDEPQSEVTPADEFMDEARREIAANPSYAPNLAEDVARTGRATTPKEDAALQLYVRDLENRRHAGENVRTEEIEAGVASKRSGTRWHEWGMTRQIELAADFSAAGILRKHLDAAGVDNPPSEEQMAKYEEMADKIAKQDAEIAELRKRKTEEEIDRLIEDAIKSRQKPAPKEKIGTKKERLQRQASDAVASFKSVWAQAMGGEQPSYQIKGGETEGPSYQLTPGESQIPDAERAKIVSAAANVVKAYAELGVNSFLEFTARVKQDIGALTEEQSKIFREEWDKQFAKAESPLGENPKPSMIGAEARSLARWAVESGIRGREKVIDAVHSALQQMGVEQTRDATMDAISGYGDFRQLPHDTVSDLVRGYRGEMQKLAQLRAMQQGEAPLRTGVEQGELTEEGRQLQKDVNEAKKKGGYTVTDPKRQLTSALQTAKTTVTNAITDADLAIKALEGAIKAKTPLAKPEERTPGPTDDDLKAMKAKLAEKRAQRKELKAQYDEIFPPKRTGHSDAQRLAMAENLMERLNKELAADIAAGNLLDKAKKEPLTSPTLTRQEALRGALKAALKAAREASPAYQAQQEAKENARYLKNLQRQEAFWNKRKEEAKAGILEKPKPKKTRTDKQILDQLVKNDASKREALAEIEAEKRRRWDLGQKIYAGLSEVATALPRELMAGLENSVVLRQGWFFTMQAPFHPVIVFSRILDGLQSMFSQRMAAASQENLRQRGNANEYDPAGIEMTVESGPLNKIDELYQSRIIGWLDKTENILWFPARWAAKAYIATARGFRTFSNGMKADLYDLLKHDTMQIRRFFNKHGMAKVPEWTQSDMELTGRSSNIFAGRGTGLKEGGILNYLLWAPKWAWSRIQAEFILPLQMATPQFLSRWNSDPAIRLAHARLYAQAAVGAAAHLAALYFALALLADDDEDKPTIDVDTTSTDLLKLKIRDTRIDVMGGLPQYLVFFSRLWHGTKKSTTGENIPLRGEGANRFKGDMWDEMTKQLRYKLGPTASGLVDFWTQKTAVGEELADNPLLRSGQIAGRRLVPMTWPDIFQAEKSLGLAQGTVASIEAFMGASVNTYGDYTNYREGTPADREKLFEKDLKGMKWDSPPPAYSEFLTPDQLKQVDARRQEVLGSAIHAGSAPLPKQKKGQSDAAYQESLQTHQDALGRLREMRQVIPQAEARKLLWGQYKDHGAAYRQRARELAKVYAEP